MNNSFKNIEIINRIGQKITSTLNLAEVIEALHKDVQTLMDASGFIIYLYNSTLKCLEIKFVLGKHKSVVEKTIPINSENSFCIYSIKNKSEVFINDVRKEYSEYISSYYWDKVPDDEIIHSFINIPLIMKGEAFGVISVQSFNKNAYTRDHLEILKSLASYMSIAFNNAETYAQLNLAKENILEQKKIIEDKNKDILDSIHYARRIQRSLLPTERYIQRNLQKMANKRSGS